jgi:dTDP-4-dehydrorhamnose 3,5-epimerase
MANSEDNSLTPSKVFDGIWTYESKKHYDERGSTYEWFNSEVRPQIFNNYNITQLLTSVSIKNVIRGIHFSKRSNPQFKIVKCVAGKILDVVIDLRMESPTFGKIDTFELDSKDSKSIMISDGFGHGFQVLSDEAIVEYAIQTNFRFEDEYVINPFDSNLGIPWQGIDYVLSDKDRNAKNLDAYFSISTDL